MTGSYDYTGRLWDLSAKDPTANPVVLRGHDGPVYATAISPDNHWLVTGSYDNTARLWDLTAKDPVATPIVLRGHAREVAAVGISPDNHWLVTGSYDNTARLWDLTATDPAANPVVLQGHEGAVEAVAISPDAHWVVTGSSDNTVRLWDLTGKDPAANPVVLGGHAGEVGAVGISPDNRWLVTASYDNTARLWPLQVTDLIDLARVTVGRNLYVEEWKLYFPGQPYHKTFSNYQGQARQPPKNIIAEETRPSDYASRPKRATEFQRHTADQNAKAFFSELTPEKKQELKEKKVHAVLIRTTRSRETSPAAKDVRMRFSVEGETLIDDYAYEFSAPLEAGTISKAAGLDVEYVGQ